MLVTAVSDLHGFLPPIDPCDLLLVAGDVCPVDDHRPPAQAMWLDTTFRRWLDAVPATHVVGVAGVGLDAADYPRDDPATVAKRGVLGYDGSATLAEVQKGRGMANAMLMVQVPHDGLTGVSP